MKFSELRKKFEGAERERFDAIISEAKATEETIKKNYECGLITFYERMEQSAYSWKDAKKIISDYKLTRFVDELEKDERSLMSKIK